MDYSAIYSSRVRQPVYDSGLPTTVADRFHEGEDYFTYRPTGRTDYLLILTLRGSGLLLSAPDKGIETKTNHLILYKPHAAQNYGTNPSAGHWDFLFAHFPARPNWLTWLNWEEPLSGLLQLELSEEVARKAEKVFRRGIYDDLSRTELRKENIFNCLERIFMMAHAFRSESGAALNALDERIRQARDYILEHPGEPFSVPSLSRMVGLSEARFAHLFRAQTGQTPQQFCEEQRLRLAENYLQFTNWPVQEIAQKVGFSDPYYFSRRFSRLKGRSPKSWRERQ